MAAQVNQNARCEIWIANATRGRWDFVYRLPNGRKSILHPIEVGQQIRITGDTTVADAQAIMTQYAPYGMRDVSEIERANEFIGLVMSRGKPVDRELYIKRVMELNHGILEERGKAIRLAAGIAISKQIEENTGNTLNSLEISIVEDERTNGTAPTFAENITISRQADPGKVTTVKRRVTAGKRRQAA
jgi:hypothetical protein